MRTRHRRPACAHPCETPRSRRSRFACASQAVAFDVDRPRHSPAVRVRLDAGDGRRRSAGRIEDRDARETRTSGRCDRASAPSHPRSVCCAHTSGFRSGAHASPMSRTTRPEPAQASQTSSPRRPVPWQSGQICSPVCGEPGSASSPGCLIRRSSVAPSLGYGRRCPVFRRLPRPFVRGKTARATPLAVAAPTPHAPDDEAPPSVTGRHRTRYDTGVAMNARSRALRSTGIACMVSRPGCSGSSFAKALTS